MRAGVRVRVASPTQGDTQSSSQSAVDVDVALVRELRENGFRSTRSTKLICTIGPATSGYEQLEQLANNGMNVARLNMCHGDREWHREVIERIRKMNEELGYSVAVMVDTEGSEVHIGDLGQPRSVQEGDEWTFTVRSIGSEQTSDAKIAEVSYDGFAEDVQAGDVILSDGGMVRFQIASVEGPDVKCVCIEPGILLPRSNLTYRRSGRLVRARNAMLPTISAKDWVDIDFAVENGADFIAISFVKTAETVKHLKSYLGSRCVPLGEETSDENSAVSKDKTVGKDGKPAVIPGVVSKIESFDSIENIAEIVEASDAVMVARGDLGAQIPLEDVPVIQQEITRACRQFNKPCIVASHLLRSMLEHPTPTRAEVADIADAVQQRADALMLSGESAAGEHPMRCLDVLRTVATRTESFMQSGNHSTGANPVHAKAFAPFPPRREDNFDEQEFVSEGLTSSAAQLADHLGASAIFVFTRRGYMASLLSTNRPECPIFAFTNSHEVRRRMNLLWGVMPFRIDLYKDDPDTTVERTFRLMLTRGLINEGDMVVVVSDVGPTTDDVRSIQVRYVKK